VLGVVTNGSVRDLDVIPENFQLLSGLVAPSHAHIHLCDFACEVNIHGMTANSNDLIHADRHGAVIIPHDVAREVPKALAIMSGREKVILDAAKRPGASVDDINKAWRVSGTLYK
jgi:regulator of RNase E activity RraA